MNKYSADTHMTDIIVGGSPRCESARKHIYNVEVSKVKHQKHELCMKGPRKGMPKMVKVPEPNWELIDAWMEINDEHTVNSILLQRTKHSLLASANSPFAQGPLAALIGEDAETDEAKAISNGTFDMSILESMERNTSTGLSAMYAKGATYAILSSWRLMRIMHFAKPEALCPDSPTTT